MDERSVFAEIEYNTPKVSRSVIAQPIAPMAADPVRERFYAMRILASGNPFARDNAEIFYKQARFMDDFTDNYPGDERFFMYYPCYQHMGYEQLRTYFTWRSKVRRGETDLISTSYVFLYIYELLSGIGTASHADSLNKLVAVWRECRVFAPAIDNYMPRWLKDYHIYYPLSHSFEDFVKENSLQEFYYDLFLFDPNVQNQLALWNRASSYKVMFSKFYDNQHAGMLRECFDCVLRAIIGFFEGCRVSFEDIFTFRISKGVVWHPFEQALFYDWLRQPDRIVTLPGQEKYVCKNNRWTADLPIQYSDRAEVAGYIIKKTESCLRRVVQFGYKLSPDPKNIADFFEAHKRRGLTLAALDRVIEKAVLDFHRNLNRTIVTVDHANLARIREEARGTQEKLIVPEEGWPIEQRCQEDPSPGDVPGGFPGNALDDPWSAFRAALSDIEREALSIVQQGGADIKAFADQNGVMLEVLIDGINEKAADHIGDCLMELDGGVTIFEEYRRYL